MDRYAPGGDIYQQLALEYGPAGADRIWRAHQTGQPQAVADVIAELKFGAPADTSTASLFFHQLATDPFGAPLETANKGIGNILGSALRGTFSNPWVLLVVVAAAAIYLWPMLRKLRR